ncbi:MAG: hypothetical protein ACJLS3_00575 [Erythrobacter sp.]
MNRAAADNVIVENLADQIPQQRPITAPPAIQAIACHADIGREGIPVDLDPDRRARSGRLARRIAKGRGRIKARRIAPAEQNTPRTGHIVQRFVPFGRAGLHRMPVHIKPLAHQRVEDFLGALYIRWQRQKNDFAQGSPPCDD